MQDHLLTSLSSNSIIDVLQEWEKKSVDELVGLETLVSELFQQIRLCLVHRVAKGALLLGGLGMGKTFLVRKIQELSPIDCQIIHCGSLIASEPEHILRLRIRDLLYSKPTQQSPKHRLIIFDELEQLVSNSNCNITCWLSHWLSVQDTSETSTMLLGVSSELTTVPESWRVSGRLSGNVRICETNFRRRQAIISKLLCNLVSAEAYTTLASRFASQIPYFTPSDILSLFRKIFLAQTEKDILGKKSDSTPHLVSVLESNPTITTKELEEKFMLAIKSFTPAGMRAGLGEIGRQQNAKFDTITLKDVFGLNTVIEELQKNLAVPLRQIAAGTAEPHSLPRGIFLHGPPGVGKTLLCRAFTSSLDTNVVFVDSTQLRSSIVGASEKAIADMFDQARSNSPCILVLDQLDALLPPRGQSVTSEGSAERIVTSFLTELDGLFVPSGNSVVVVIGISNLPSNIDPAILRPGRLDIHLHISLPNPDQRLAILKGKLSPKAALSDEQIMQLIDLSDGFSGADLENICQEAALSTLRSNINALDVPYEAYVQAVKSTRRN